MSDTNDSFFNYQCEAEASKNEPNLPPKNPTESKSESVIERLRQRVATVEQNYCNQFDLREAAEQRIAELEEDVAEQHSAILVGNKRIAELEEKLTGYDKFIASCIPPLEPVHIITTEQIRNAIHDFEISLLEANPTDGPDGVRVMKWAFWWLMARLNIHRCENCVDWHDMGYDDPEFHEDLGPCPACHGEGWVIR